MRILLCDDDTLVLEQLKKLLEHFFENVHVKIPEIVSYTSGEELLKDKEQKDIVFLDIEMNSTKGLDIAHALPPESCLIFTTAHAQYALDGFDLDAVDLLHKPFAYERFEKAVEKAIVLIEARQHKVPENIIIKQEYNNISIPISDILYIEAMENYTKIFRINGNYILSRTSLKSIQEMLPEKAFLRTHRSYIIPVNKVERFSKREINLTGCRIVIPIGRQYAENVYATLTARNMTL